MGLDAQIGVAVREFEVRLRAATAALAAARDAASFCAAERSVHGLSGAFADEIVGTVLRHMAMDGERTRQTVAALRSTAPTFELKLQGVRSTPVRLLGGTEVSVPSQYLYARPTRPTKTARGKAGTGVFPVLDQLGIRERSTPALRLRVAHVVAEASSVTSAREVLEQNGLNIDHKRSLRLTYAVSDLAVKVREREVAATATGNDDGEFVGRRVAVCIDGGRVQIRKALRGGPKKGGRRPFELEWREPKVLTIYALDDTGRRDKGTRAVIDATMGDADASMRLLLYHLRRLGVHKAEHVAFLGDGAPWIWRRTSQIRVALGLEPSQFTEITDYFHLVERLYKFARSRPGWTESRAVAWTQRTKRRLKAGQIEHIEKAIERQLTRDEQKDGVEMDFWSRNRDRMRFKRFREQGLPNGSGAVESAVRRVLNLRMKGPGIAWKEEHAEGMLLLRSHSKAGRWAEVERVELQNGGWMPTRRVRRLK